MNFVEKITILYHIFVTFGIIAAVTLILYIISGDNKIATIILFSFLISLVAKIHFNYLMKNSSSANKQAAKQAGF